MDVERCELLVKGSIVGFLTGDAVGYACVDSTDISEHNEIAIEEYTSFGSFMLATISSINDCEELNLHDLLEKLYDVYIAGYLTPNKECHLLSNTTSSALRRFSNGFPADRCGINSDDLDCMGRVLPIALFYATKSTDCLIRKVHEVCNITHADSLVCTICDVYALILGNLLLQKSEKVFDKLKSYYSTNNMQEHLESLALLHERRNFDSVGCFWTIWDAFSKYENDYFFSVIEAVKTGKDKNISGAVTGSIAALNNGLNDIPSKWLRTISLSSEAMGIILKFIEMTVSCISSNGD